MKANQFVRFSICLVFALISLALSTNAFAQNTATSIDTDSAVADANQNSTSTETNSDSAVADANQNSTSTETNSDSAVADASQDSASTETNSDSAVADASQDSTSTEANSDSAVADASQDSYDTETNDDTMDDDDDDSSSTEADSKAIDYEATQDRSSFEWSLGLGAAGKYAAGFGGNIYFGFAARYFGVGTELSALCGPDSYSAFNITAIPRLFIPSGRFRFSLGFGLGYGTFNPIRQKGQKAPERQHALALKPEMQFDWFFTSSTYIGFGVDWTGYIDVGGKSKDVFNPHDEAFSNIYIYLHLGNKY